MKGKISLKEFIVQIKEELVEAQSDPGDEFYELRDVELEVSFALEAKGGAKGKLVVVELGGETTASQLHKVTLKLKPLGILHEGINDSSDPTKDAPRETVTGGGGGDVGWKDARGNYRGPKYDKIKDSYIP